MIKFFGYHSNLRKHFAYRTIAIWIIFTIAFSLRLGLAIVNNGRANDNHLEVSTKILNEGKLPEPKDCWQCYHPKLYHYTVAQLWKVFRIETKKSRYILAQMLNALAGIITIFLFWLFLKERPISGRVRLLLISLIALNPRLIAINAQASNDSFMILFATITLYSLYRYICTFSVKYYLLLLIFTCLAGLTKGNALVIIIGICVVFTIKIIGTGNFHFSITKGCLGAAIIFVLFVPFFVGYFGQYYGNYKKYGEPIGFNTPLNKKLHFIKETSFRRPGVKSILGGYFTFRLFDMIRMPRITNSEDTYPKHRTSVWSQLYGRTHFLYFDYWPPGIWRSNNPIMMNAGRAALILALFPSVLFLFGTFNELKIWFIALKEKNYDFITYSNEWIFHVFIVGFTAFIILFTAFGQDFSFMKIIYVFPGLLAALIPFSKGLEQAYTSFQHRKMVTRLFDTTIIALLIFYVIPVLDVIRKGFLLM